jgi:uncharacterized Zn finger protein
MAQRFIEALERYTDPGRLGRGHSYANGNRIIAYGVANGTVTAKVRGSVNPYFGVYKEPRYTVTITLTPIVHANWSKIIARLSAQAGPVAKLLANEMPDDLEAVFAGLGLYLLPHNRADFATDCSCPDYANPCKHVAGVCYMLAAQLDRDPFLLFELRGLSRERLREELAASPLGKILSSELAPKDFPLQSAASLYTRPRRDPPRDDMTVREFWTGAKRLPPLDATPSGPRVPAALIKRQGDYPPFWRKDTSFIEVMEDIYNRVRTKSPYMK